MSFVNDINNELLIKSIREILESADLNVMTAKLVRNELKTKLNVEDLDSRKKQINGIINDVINELNQRNQKQSKVKEIKTESIVDNKSENSSKNKQKKSNESDDSSSDDSVSDANEDISDEQLARKLHNQELDTKRRPQRTTRNKPTKTTKKTPKKQKNKDPDESESDKPKKKAGYLKSCALSTDLAHFLGEPEMARHEVVKRIWSYVKENNLLDPKNKQFAICDDQLHKVFGRKRVRMFGMMKLLAKHLK